MQCSKCGALGSLQSTPAQAVEAWNSRPRYGPNPLVVAETAKLYLEELQGTVALPCRMGRSLLTFANALRVHIEEELNKLSPDNALVAVLCDAGRIGWEYIECMATEARCCRLIGGEDV